MKVLKPRKAVKKVLNEKSGKEEGSDCQCQADFNEQVAKKAYELYEKRGCADGYDLQDWLDAEKIVRAQK